MAEAADGTSSRDRGAGTTDGPWLTPEQLDAWLDLAAFTVRLPAALESQLQKDFGLTLFEYYVMAHLSESPGRQARMSDLAVMANGSLSRLSHVASRLERRGFVERRPSPDDGRTTLATLTDAGMAALVETAPAHVARVRDLVVDVLTPEQLRALGTACALVVERIEAREGTTTPRPPRRGRTSTAT